ncbi:MAG: PAS domain S-box protein [Armatimonadetes bacterium]|nr:PAS domain S-box protein [Armatimonadota bacterium]
MPDEVTLLAVKPALRLLLCGPRPADDPIRRFAEALPGWAVGGDGEPASPPDAVCVWITPDATAEQVGRADADARLTAGASPLILVADAGFTVEEAAPRLAEAAAAILRSPLDVPAVRALFRSIAREQAQAAAAEPPAAPGAPKRAPRMAEELARAQFVMDHMADAVFLVTFDGRIHYANSAVCAMLGYEPDEILRVSVFDVIGPENVARWPALWDALRAAAPLLIEGENWTKSGAAIPVEVRLSLLTYGGLEYACSFVRDISGRKEAEATLADSVARFRALSEEASWGVLVAYDGRLTYVNQALATMAGRSREELIGASAMDLVYPEDRAVIQEHMARAAAGETGPLRYQLRGIGAGGELRHFEVVGVTTWLSEQRTFIGTLTDITDRLESERKLARLNRALRCIGACRGAVAHAPDERTMLAEVCRAIVDVGGHRLAWVGFAEDDADRRVRPIVWAGHEDGYLAAAQIVWSDTPGGRGPTGAAIRTGRVSSAGSFADDPRLSLWREEGVRRGFRSSIALPLRTDAGVIGAMTIYSDRDGAFDADEAQLLVELVDDIGVGITMARTRVARDQAEQRLRTLGDNLPGGMLYQLHAEPGGLPYVSYVSAGVADLFGVSVEEAGRSPEALIRHITEDDRMLMERALERSARELTVAEVEVQWHAPGGEAQWRHMRAMPRRLDDGSTTWDGVILDITEHRRADRRLHEAEQRRDLALEAGQMGTWDWDLVADRVTWSSAHSALLGLDRSIQGGTPGEFVARVHPEDLEALLRLGEESKVGRTPFRTEFRVVWPDGAVRWLTSQGQHEYDAAGNATRLHGVAFDITDRRTAEDRLRRLSEMQAGLLGPGSLDGKLDIVARGVVSIFGADFARIWLMRPGDRCLTGCLHATTDVAAHRCPDRAGCLHLAASAGRYTNLDGPLRSRIPRGSYKVGAVASGAVDGFLTNDIAGDPLISDHQWARDAGLAASAVCPLRSHEGEALGAMAVFWRRTVSPEEEALLNGICSLVVRLVNSAQAEEALRESREQLLQVQKMESVGTLAGGIAHDFNNLLMGLTGYLQLCGDQLDALHPAREHLTEAMAQANRSAELTRRLLGFARKQTITPRVIDLNDTIGHMLKMLRRLVREDIDIVWTAAAAPCVVRMDPSQVDQILANLTVNARDAIDGVGAISISTELVEVTQEGSARHAYAAPGQYVALTVRDTGCGMDEATASRIFEPFFTTKGLGHGTGLGLSTVYGIVKQNDGFIAAESRPGAGSTFRVYLPRDAGQPVSSEPAPGPAAAGGRETILLAEDEKSIRVTARAFLKAAGYTVLDAEDPESALRAAARHPGRIDLLVTDMVMPGMSGIELAGELTRSRPNLRTVYMSGYTAEAIAAKDTWDESLDLLTKPFGKAVLLHKVREVLDRE